MPMPSNIEDYEVDAYSVRYINGVTVSVSRNGESAEASSRVSESDAFLKAIAKLDGGAPTETVVEEPTHLVAAEREAPAEEADVSPGSAEVSVDAEGEDARPSNFGDSDNPDADPEGVKGTSESFDFNFGDAVVDADPAF